MADGMFKWRGLSKTIPTKVHYSINGNTVTLMHNDVIIHKLVARGDSLVWNSGEMKGAPALKRVGDARARD